MANNNEFAYGLKGPTATEAISRAYRNNVMEAARIEGELAAKEFELEQLEKQAREATEERRHQETLLTEAMSAVIQAKAIVEAAQIQAQSRNNDGGTVTLTNEQFQQLLDAAKSKY